jgi:hypothetical protein
MVPHQADNTLLPAGAATLFDVHDTFDGCDDERCWAYYYVALGAGQRVHVTAEGGELFVMGLATRRVGTWYDPTYHWEAIDMEAGVPYRGWYRVALATAKARGREMQVTWAAVP